MVEGFKMAHGTGPQTPPMSNDRLAELGIEGF